MNNKPEENPNFSVQISTEEATNSYFKETKETPEWHNSSPEGELAVDVIDSKEHLIIISTMAGAVVNKVNVNIHNDLLTIRGVRNLPLEQESDLEFYHQECYWGPFSRTIVLPVDAKAEMAYAEYKNGILKIFIPKQDTERDVPINIIEE